MQNVPFEPIIAARAQRELEKDAEKFQREAGARGLQSTISQSIGLQKQEIAIARAEVENLAARVTALEQEMKQHSNLAPGFMHVQTVPIHTLGPAPWRLKEPLLIAIEQRSENHFVACVYDVDLYGYGETIPDAIDDLKVMILDQFEYLSERQQTVKLGSMPKKQLDFLEDILVKKDA